MHIIFFIYVYLDHTPHARVNLCKYVHTYVYDVCMYICMLIQISFQFALMIGTCVLEFMRATATNWRGIPFTWRYQPAGKRMEWMRFDMIYRCVDVFLTAVIFMSMRWYNGFMALAWADKLTAQLDRASAAIIRMICRHSCRSDIFFISGFIATPGEIIHQPVA